MAHGSPDWGRTNAAATVYQVKDLGELAVRLGSIVTHDRRGDVIWYDDFEETLNKWGSTTSGTGAAVAIDTTWARNGAQSVKLTGGSDSSQSAGITHGSPITTLSKMGGEVSFSTPATFDQLLVTLSVYNGAQQIYGQVQMDQTNAKLNYLNSSGSYVELADDLGLVSGNGYFHTLKLVIDPTAHEYVRLILDDTEYDLSGIDLETAVDFTPARAEVDVTLLSRAGQNDAAWVDDTIITQNEP